MTSKYRNIKTVIDGVTFDSKKEAARYQQLKLLERAGEIRHLTLQPRFPLDVNGKHICDYVADFTYIDQASGKSVTEDAKGMRTPVYKLKKKLTEALFHIRIVEV